MTVHLLSTSPLPPTQGCVLACILGTALVTLSDVQAGNLAPSYR